MSVKAVAIAIVATFALDILTAVALTALLGGPLFQPGMSDEEMRAAVTAFVATRSFQVSSLILGTFSTVVGGYLAGHFAKTLPYMNAFAFGLFGLVFGALTTDEMPLWYNILGFGLMLPAALFGGHIAKRGLKGFPW
ncbi:MAG TPA: hypothetical protein VIT67_17440 [Povalibacter sp.]